MSFPAYDKYQATGIEWFPKVPSEWTVTKLGRLLDELPCYGVLVPDSDDDGMPMLRITDMENGNANRHSLNKISQALSDQYSRTLVEVGDVVLSVVGTIGVAFKVDTDLAGVNLSRAVARIQVSDALHAEYLCWIFQSIQFRRYVDLICTGTAQRVLNMGDLTAFSVAAPDIDEQRAISSFLDVETSKIDGLVSEQRRLIELLKEKRQAVISHAVTKGLNPNAPMKPSGIQWLGDVPEHWDVVKVKHGITKIGQGWSPNCHSEPASDDEWGVVKVGCCNKFDLNEAEQKRLPLEIEPVIDYEIQNGDILMSRGNTIDLVGMAALVQDVRPRLLLCDLVYRFRARDELFDPAFLVHSLRSKNVRSQIACNAVGSSATMKKVSQELVRNLEICRPPLKEQQEISQRLATKIATFDSLVDDAERAIELLQERRTALISAAVTGKIDVRGLAETVAP